MRYFAFEIAFSCAGQPSPLEPLLTLLQHLIKYHWTQGDVCIRNSQNEFMEDMRVIEGMCAAQAARRAMREGAWLRALLVTLRLKDAQLLRQVILGTPPEEVCPSRLI